MPDPRIAIITMGQSPRPDLLAELLTQAGPAQPREFGVLDGLSRAEIASLAPAGEEARFFSPLADGTHVVVATRFIEERVAELVARLDDGGCDLIVVAGTGPFAPLVARAPLVHAQRAVDAWVAALMGEDLALGLIYPLPQQGGRLALVHRTQLQSAHATIAGGHGIHLPLAAEGVSRADLILMYSIGYSEAMARLVQQESGRPVVTARRILAAAIGLRLGEITGRAAAPGPRSYTGEELLRHVPEAATLTPREHEVLLHALEGAANKVIARALRISHRTVEIHRSRAMAKLGVTSVVEVIRRALAERPAA